ncbi:MAG: potassium transporter TrkA [Candidatus Lambdaproteobacteria bacterium RIFOXYD12_FULL_49_8]|uniref:Potassium transporter TrkA n=1 Tax=Candidatus Lambdaproteobacteria bacterium RIFOXYD2_FULL_50_16 TaxID=1817772 RepID=A0A1F6GEG4_9PROT|nr:MAG: potassium transporter TrkA [Candidatus Lambdaproteobacteria bacterium RIFOXYD2_FULL_50_16]OGG98166.1 MAG: potassium transporter TrkA [Candidatus Lambdaproteobacteria bacterium RIFOXYD12_FULL_49_8]
MLQQILIIGLGHFGMSLARALSDKGAEILAIDTNIQLINEVSLFVADAVCMDATDEAELAKLEPWKRDAAVCCIGDDSKEASIIVTALLRQMGTKLVVSRANDAVHQRILQLVGAHQILNPEQEFGKRFANRLLFRHLMADAPLGDDLQLAEVMVRAEIVGQNLAELKLPKRFGVLVVGVRRGPTGRILQPSPHESLQADDILLVVGNEEAIPKFLKGIA